MAFNKSNFRRFRYTGHPVCIAMQTLWDSEARVFLCLPRSVLEDGAEDNENVARGRESNIPNLEGIEGETSTNGL